MGNSLATLFADVQEITSQALSYTRTLVSQLYPPVLKEFGLLAALRWLAEQLQLSDFRVTMQIRTQISPLPDDQARFLFQAVRELLHNCQKYAHVSKATIILEEFEGMLCITVSDQGIGFATDSVMGKNENGNKGFGLFSIRERMFSLGGKFDLNAAPGKGAEVKLGLPLLSAFREPLEKVSTGAGGRTSNVDGLVYSKLRIVVADDQTMVREGICGVLSTYEDIEVVGKHVMGRKPSN